MLADIDSALMAWGDWLRQTVPGAVELGFKRVSNIHVMRRTAPRPEKTTIAYVCTTCSAKVQRHHRPRVCTACGYRGPHQFIESPTRIHASETTRGVRLRGLPDDEIAQGVEAILVVYKAKDLEGFQAIYLRYVRRWTFRLMAEEMHLNERTVRGILDRAHHWLDGYLTSGPAKG